MRQPYEHWKLWRLGTAVIGMLLGAACALSPEDARARLIDFVIGELRPNSTVTRERLEFAVNTRGEGLLLYSTTSADQTELVAWLVGLHGRTYALTPAAQRETPNLPLLSDGSAEALEQSGLAPDVEMNIQALLRDPTPWP